MVEILLPELLGLASRKAMVKAGQVIKQLGRIYADVHAWIGDYFF